MNIYEKQCQDIRDKILVGGTNFIVIVAVSDKLARVYLQEVKCHFPTVPELIKSYSDDVILDAGFPRGHVRIMTGEFDSTFVGLQWNGLRPIFAVVGYVDDVIFLDAKDMKGWQKRYMESRITKAGVTGPSSGDCYIDTDTGTFYVREKAWKAKTAHDTAKNGVTDEINNPSHYTQHPSGIECIQITEHMSFNLGNAMKYIWRCGEKGNGNEVKDLKKAIWYLNREISRIGEHK